MSTRKKTAKKKAPSAKAPAAPIAQKPGSLFAAVRNVTMAELTCKIEKPLHVFIRAAVDAVGRAAVHDLAANGEAKNLVVPARLKVILEGAYPKDGYVSRAFEIVRHERKKAKNAHGFTVTEIDPDKPL
jgi:hypothetical protein